MNAADLLAIALAQSQIATLNQELDGLRRSLQQWPLQAEMRD